MEVNCLDPCERGVSRHVSQYASGFGAVVQWRSLVVEEAVVEHSGDGVFESAGPARRRIIDTFGKYRSLRRMAHKLSCYPRS